MNKEEIVNKVVEICESTKHKRVRISELRRDYGFGDLSSPMICSVLKASGKFERQVLSKKVRYWKLLDRRLVTTEMIIDKCYECPHCFEGKCQELDKPIQNTGEIASFCRLEKV